LVEGDATAAFRLIMGRTTANTLQQTGWIASKSCEGHTRTLGGERWCCVINLWAQRKSFVTPLGLPLIRFVGESGARADFTFIDKGTIISVADEALTKSPVGVFRAECAKNRRFNGTVKRLVRQIEGHRRGLFARGAHACTLTIRVSVTMEEKVA
jgi:hypothetical protein